MKRPFSITLICALSVFNAGYMLVQVLSGVAGLITPWYPVYLGVLIVAELLCALGLWNMQKWAAYLYCGIIAVTFGVGFMFGGMSTLAMGLSAYAFFTMLYFAKRMR